MLSSGVSRITFERVWSDGMTETVVIANNNPDEDFAQLYEMMKSLALAAGFHPDTVAEYMDQQE